jgi:DNA-binding transcriptional LysR family regulator
MKDLYGTTSPAPENQKQDLSLPAAAALSVPRPEPPPPPPARLGGSGSGNKPPPRRPLVLNEKATSELLGDLRDRRLDVAFLRPTTGETEGLLSEHLFDERMTITLPHSHRLAKRSRLPLLELAGEPFIMYPRTNGSAIYDTIIAACQNAGFSPRIAQEAPQISSTVNLVATGIGVTLVPESMSHLQTHRVVYRPIVGEAPRATMSLAVRGGPTSAALESFLTTVRALVAEQRTTNARGSRQDRRA